MNPLEFINQIKDMYNDQDPRPMAQGSRNMYAGGQLVTPSVDGARPGYRGDKTQEVLKAYKEYKKSHYNSRHKYPIIPFTKFFEMYAKENFADGGSAGQLVTPSVDGSRPGYNGQDAYTINRDKKRAEAKEKGKVYDVETKRFRKSKVPVSQYGAGASRDMKEYMKQYYKDTKEYTESGKLQIERDKKLKEFIGNKKKISSTALRDFVINELGYKDYRADKFKKRFPNLEIVKDIKYRPDAKPLTKQEKTIVMENFDLPEGVKKWDFKQHKYGISNTKYTRLYDQIKNRLDDKIKYKVAGNFSLPKGWMMNAMNRLYENETVLKDGKRVLKEGVKKLTYEPIKNKKGLIVGFKDNTASGGGKTYYATEKAANQFGDGTAWTAHGDYSRISKFLDIANGVKAEPNKVLQKILTQKGINVPGLTLNDVLSHQRYYSILAETKPSELIKRQIVLHHTKGVGDQNLARAAATKDIQLLTSEINSKVMKLENIVKGTSTTPGRKLTLDEIQKLKNYGAKIVDFDGKVVGGGYLDPERQFAGIEKKALQYAKGKDFNVKTVASYLERLGCGKAAGGRVFYNEGAFGLTKCAEKGRLKLENIVTKGASNADDAMLAKTILKAGGGLKSAFALRTIFGPAAIAATVAFEGGLIGYDMLTSGKTLREAFGDNLLNYALGKDYQIDPQEEMFKRFKGLGYNDQQIGSIKKALDAMNTINTGTQLAMDVGQQQEALQKSRVQPEPFMGPDDQMMADTAGQRAEQNLKDAQERLTAFNRSLEAVDGPPGGSRTKEDVLSEYFSSGKYAEDLDLFEQAQKEADIQKLESAGPKFMGSVFPQFEKGRQEDLVNLRSVVNPAFNIPGMREATGGYLYGFANGGILKEAGDSSGPPPESGPNSQGLQGLMKRVKKL